MTIDAQYVLNKGILIGCFTRICLNF